MKVVPITVLISEINTEAMSISTSLTPSEIKTAHKIVHSAKSNVYYIKRYQNEFNHFISDLRKIQLNDDPEINSNSLQELILNQKTQIKSLIYAEYLLMLAEIFKTDLTLYADYDSALEVIQDLYQYGVTDTFENLLFKLF